MTSIAKKRFAFGIMQLPPGVDRPPPLHFAPFLSGKRLLTTQTFRDLFRSEVIGGNEGIGVKDIALLFTDLKGSTALYDRIGDLNAFALVQQHFEQLQGVTVRHNGAIIKTIGDAVMAAFLNPADAVQAALDMRSEIAAFNERQPDKALILKIGVHKGAAIAVTLNERLDYFGQTVNIAARVQNLADADEIFVSQDVYDAARREATKLAAFRGRAARRRSFAACSRSCRCFASAPRRPSDRPRKPRSGASAPRSAQKMSWLSPASRRSSDVETRRQARRRIRPLLQHAERARLEPAARGGARERLLAEALAVGRVEKDEVERRDRAGARRGRSRRGGGSARRRSGRAPRCSCG